ncbi:MAG: DUF58 domain-containing protein [Candidatus Kapaibacteriales bacterium]
MIKGTTQELINKVRKIEIKTRGLSEQLFSGEYHSAFKGRGMAFSEVREYSPGDDIRTIDWNVTARSGDAHVKVFEEERELTVFIIVDISASGNFGSTGQEKAELMAELAATIAFSAIKNSDKVGLILFSDQIELYVPPSKGKKHILRMVRDMLKHEQKSKGTNINVALEFLARIAKKRAICFLMSDFISPDYSSNLGLVAKKHDLVAMNIGDKLDREIPNIGLSAIKDPETGKSTLIDTSSKSVRQKYLELSDEVREETSRLLRKKKVDEVILNTGEDFAIPLHTFFKRRLSR